MSLIPAAMRSVSESCLWVVLAGCRTQLRQSAMCVTMAKSLSAFWNLAAASLPPLYTEGHHARRHASVKIFLHLVKVRVAGQSRVLDPLHRGWPLSIRATARALLLCLGILRCRVSIPFIVSHAFIGAICAPKSLIPITLARVM